IGRLFPIEDSACIDADLTVSVGKVGSVARQSTRHYGIAQLVARWHGIARRQRDDLLAPVVEERATLSTRSALRFPCARLANAISISRSLVPLRITTSRPSARPACCASRDRSSAFG